MMSIINDRLAIREDANGMRRKVILLASKLCNLGLFGVVIGQERRTYLRSWNLEEPSLYESNREKP